MSQLTIRQAYPADADAIASVQVDTWKSTYAGMIPDASLEFFTDREQRQQRWRENLVRAESGQGVLRAYVAQTEAGDVIGFAIAGPARRQPDDPPGVDCCAGEVYAIYVLASAQGQGAGRRLMAACSEYLRDCGLNGLLVWALEDNTGARGFYERLGGRLLGRRQIDLAGALVTEAGYGWEQGLS